MQKFLRSRITLTIATVLAGLFGTAASFAAVVADGGGPLLRVDTRSSTLPAGALTSFTNLPGAQVRIVIPTSGGSRLVIARFTAESECIGTPAGGLCSVRIIAFNTGTSLTTEMHPQSLGFGFDTIMDPADVSDGSESHSVERSLRLNPGTYLIRVQSKVASENAAFTLDDWHLTVSQYD